MAAMEQLATSCEKAMEYPKNLIYHNIYEHSTNAYFDRLNEQQGRLLYDEKDKSAMDFWERDVQARAFWHERIHDVGVLKRHLRGENVVEREDPRCRFIFIQALHSRDRLAVTREMITLAFTYHQVMPTFLDLVFAFGEQQYERDFHFLGFRQDNRLDELDQGLKITELGWSGREFRLSYSLKSVEPSPDQTYFPWSIRQTAVYHSFDVETGRAIWIVIKGDQLLKSRIKSATGSRGLPELSSYQTVDRAFASALATHMILCHWPAEHWRWYISFLEEEYQAISRRTLSVSFKNSSRLMSGGIPIPSTQRVKSHNPVTAPSPKTRALPPIAPTTMPSNNGADARNDRLGQQEFSFTDLQRLQFLEEKANETHLVLEANINVLTELEHHYRSTAESQDWPQKLKSRDVLRFEKRVASIITELRMQRTRTENLLRSLANRKSLLYGMLEYHNLEASKELSVKAQKSAGNMEAVTYDMHGIAQKTKQETISMRIITFVTLFFLPGTFVSTLMSTDIVHFDSTSMGKSGKNFQLGALQLYFAISIPLMATTLLAWYGVYWWETRKERQQAIPNPIKCEV